MADIFGDPSLFSEFEKDRDTQNIFIHYDKDEGGCENRSRIIFRGTESNEESSDDEDFGGEDTRFTSDKIKKDASAENAVEICNDTPEITECEGKSFDPDVIGDGMEESSKEVGSGDDDNACSQSTTYQEQFELKKLHQFTRLIDSTSTKKTEEEQLMEELLKKVTYKRLTWNKLQATVKANTKHKAQALLLFNNGCSSVPQLKSWWVPDEQSPGVQVIFQNNKFARKYRARIEQFIISLTEHADKKDFSKSSLEISNRLAVPSCVDLNKALPPEKRTNQMWQTHGVIGCAQFHHGFMVDTQGWPLEADDPALCTNWEVPKYYQVFDQVYPPEPAANSSIPAKPAKPKETCFNCDGDHRLNDCKLARDMDRIRTNRREHQKKSGSSTNYSGRYHKESELHPTKQKFKPGKISDELREAMGLLPNQLPPYIYRMRLFGYPPGWLIEANRKMSSLAMYDKDGRETDLRGESLEDGEVGEPSSDYGGTDTYDIQKIIEYPGFTVPVPLGFVDDSASIGMPPIQQHQLKKTLMEDTISKDAAKKRRLEDEEAEKKKRIKTEEDMEVEDAEAVPQSQQPSESKAGQNDGKESPSMDKLQEQYLQLVQELGNESLESNGATTPSSNDSTKGVDSNGDATPSANESVSDAEILRQTNFSFKSTTSISKDYGTPIMIKDDSFKVLPSPEKFSQGIEDHIPFENLPDSVGTFEKMRNIFRQIRDKVKGKKK